jgi:VanZ family protein
MMSTASRWKWLGLVYGAVFCLILVLAYRGELPPILTQNDKVAHVGLYGIATFVGHQALAGRSFFGRLPLFPTLFGIFTLVEEIAQSQSPNRTFDLGDLVASFAGIAIGWAIAQWQIQKRK